MSVSKLARLAAISAGLAMVAIGCSDADSDAESKQEVVATVTSTTVAESTTSVVSTTTQDPETTTSVPTTTASSTRPRHVEGHRGARGLKPENTLPAFETALDLGVEVLEFDLHLSSDGVVMVWHDDVLEASKCRLGDSAPEGLRAPSPSSGIPIAQTTAAELALYQCDLNPDEARFPAQDRSPTDIAGDDYRPITLVELLEFVQAYSSSEEKSADQRDRAATVEFNMETKRDPGGSDNIGDGFDGVEPGLFENEILAIIADAGVADRVVVQSFDFRSLWAVRSVDADIRLAALSFRTTPDLEELAQQGANIWSPNFRGVTDELIDEAHDLGLLVIPWTVNEVEDMLAFLDAGADGVITDRPDLAAELP